MQEEGSAMSYHERFTELVGEHLIHDAGNPSACQKVRALVVEHLPGQVAGESIDPGWFLEALQALVARRSQDRTADRSCNAAHVVVGLMRALEDAELLHASTWHASHSHSWSFPTLGMQLKIELPWSRSTIDAQWITQPWSPPTRDEGI